MTVAVLALDQGTQSLGWATATARGDVLDAGAQRFRGRLAADRLPDVMAYCRAMFDQHVGQGVVVALEGAFLQTRGKANPHTLDVLSELRGRIAEAAESRGLRVLVVSAAEWRKSAGIHPRTGRLKAKAAAVRLAALHLPCIGEVVSADDAAEAVLLAIHAAGWLRFERALRESAA